MGYYTGSIFEIEHPESGSSIGGGGRYDGMIGRWLGSDVPAVGISIGFERAVDLVSSDVSAGGLVLVLDDSSYLGTALQIQRDLIAAGEIVRIELRPKKLNTLLDSLALQGFSKFAVVDGSVSAVAELNVRSIG
jgi:histidyl-tRNA synthetase